MKSFDRKVIVLGDHLSLVQEYGKNGIGCIALDTGHSISSYSRYADRRKCPDPTTREAEAVQFLYDICEQDGNRPILIPYSDTWTMAISKHKDRFLKVSDPCVADFESVQLLLNKDRFCKWGEDRGFMTPHTWTLEEATQLSEEHFPIVAKPAVHRMSSNDDGGLAQNMDRLRFELVNSSAELRDFLRKEESFLKFLTFQEYVRGMSDCMYSVGIYADRSSKILGQFTGHKLRGYPASYGDCIIGETVDLPQELLGTCKSIVDELHYSGLAEFEFKKDSKTGEFKLIEVNPRAWSWIGITPACGVNLPLIAYLDLTDSYLQQTLTPYPGKVKFIHLLKDFNNCLFRYRIDHPEWSKSLGGWIKDIKADRIVFYEFNGRDWLVSVILIADFIRDLSKELVRSNHLSVRSLSGRPHHGSQAKV